MRALALLMVAGTGLFGLSGCVDANSYRANAYRPPVRPQRRRPPWCAMPTACRSRLARQCAMPTATP
jgi:hypothetical protein